MRFKVVQLDSSEQMRVFSDYRDVKDEAGEAVYRRILKMQWVLGAQPEFVAIAGYTQLIGTRSKRIGRKR